MAERTRELLAEKLLDVARGDGDGAHLPPAEDLKRDRLAGAVGPEEPVERAAVAHVHAVGASAPFTTALPACDNGSALPARAGRTARCGVAGAGDDERPLARRQVRRAAERQRRQVVPRDAHEG